MLYSGNSLLILFAVFHPMSIPQFIHSPKDVPVSTFQVWAKYCCYEHSYKKNIYILINNCLHSYKEQEL